jgi:hypothetical protein
MEWGYFNRASSGLINGISVCLFYKSDKFSFNNASQSDLAPYSSFASIKRFSIRHSRCFLNSPRALISDRPRSSPVRRNLSDCIMLRRRSC